MPNEYITLKLHVIYTHTTVINNPYMNYYYMQLILKLFTTYELYLTYTKTMCNRWKDPLTNGRRYMNYVNNT